MAALPPEQEKGEKGGQQSRAHFFVSTSRGSSGTSCQGQWLETFTTLEWHLKWWFLFSVQSLWEICSYVSSFCLLRYYHLPNVGGTYLVQMKTLVRQMFPLDTSEERLESTLAHLWSSNSLYFSCKNWTPFPKPPWLPVPLRFWWSSLLLIWDEERSMSTSFPVPESPLKKPASQILIQLSTWPFHSLSWVSL